MTSRVKLTLHLAVRSQRSEATRSGSGRPEGRSVPYTMALFHTPRKGERDRDTERGREKTGTQRLRAMKARAVEGCQDRFTQLSSSLKEDQ